MAGAMSGQANSIERRSGVSLWRQIADRAVVMLKGEICHAGGVESLFEDDAHPYVKALLAAVPGKTLDALPQGRTAPQFVLSE